MESTIDTLLELIEDAAGQVIRKALGDQKMEDASFQQLITGGAILIDKASVLYRLKRHLDRPISISPETIEEDDNGSDDVEHSLESLTTRGRSRIERSLMPPLPEQSGGAAEFSGDDDRGDGRSADDSAEGPTFGTTGL